MAWGGGVVRGRGRPCERGRYAAMVCALDEQLRAELDGRWRCDTATRRALLTDADAERLLDDVAARARGAV